MRKLWIVLLLIVTLPVGAEEVTKETPALPGLTAEQVQWLDQMAEAKDAAARKALLDSRPEWAAEALPLFERAARAFAAAGDRKRAGDAFRLAGSTAKEDGRHEEAVSHFQSAIGHYEVLEGKDPAGSLAECLVEGGGSYILMNRPKDAGGWLERAITLSEKSGDTAHLANSHRRLGIARRDTGDLDGALQSLQAATPLFTTLGDQELLVNCHRQIADVHRRAGRHHAALAAQDLARFLEAGGREGTPAVTEEQFRWLDAVGASTTDEEMEKRAKEHPEWANPAFARSAVEGIVWHLVPVGVMTRVARGFAHLADTIEDRATVALGRYVYARVLQENHGPDQDNREISIKTYDEARAVFEELGYRRRVAECYLHSGNVVNVTGRHDEAIQRYEKAIPLFLEVGDKVQAAYTYMVMGNAWRDAGRPTEARTAYETYWKMSRGDGNRLGEIGGARYLGELDLEMGRFREAEEWFRNARDVSKMNAMVQQHAQAHSWLGEVYHMAGRSQEALSVYEAALGIAERHHLPLEIAAARFGLAREYGRMGQTGRAIAEVERAIEAYKEGNDWAGAVNSLRLVALTLADAGQPVEAAGVLDTAIGMEVRAGRPLMVGDTILLAAYIQQESNDNRGALENLNAAMRYYEQAAAVSGKEVLRSRMVLVKELMSMAHSGLQHPDEAISLAKEALAVRKELGNPVEIANACSVLAGALVVAGRHEEAVAACEAGLRAVEGAGIPRMDAFMLLRLGESLLEAGRARDAIVRLQEARPLLEGTGQVSHLTQCLYQLALAYRGVGDHAQAEAHYRAALDLQERVRDAAKDPALSSGIDAAYPAAPLAVLALRRGDAAAAFAFAQRGKGVAVRRSLIGTRNLLRNLPEEEARELREARIFYEAAEQRLAGDPDSRQAKEGRDIAMAKLGATESVLRVKYPRWSELSAPPATVEQVAEALGDRGAALEVMIDDSGKQLALVLVRERNGKPHIAGKTVEVDPEKLWGWTDKYREELQAIDDGNEQTLSQLSRRFYDLMIAPIEKELDGIDTLVICPDRFLHGVPFGALQDAKGRYLIERVAVTVAPSASAFEACRYLAGSGERTLSGPALVTAISEFSGQPKLVANLAPGRARRGDAIANLPEVLREAEVVEKALGVDTVLLLDKSATVEAVEEKAPKARVLHFATHAFANDQVPLQSALLLSPSEGRQMGLLYARDVYQMQLTADLAVLSGCSTMEGNATGEGLMGLAWAFLVAGCPSTVATRWPVDDLAARKWMEAFYGSYATEKRGAARSFQGAAKALLATKGTPQDLSSPRHWAAWSLLGNDR